MIFDQQFGKRVLRYDIDCKGFGDIKQLECLSVLGTSDKLLALVFGILLCYSLSKNSLSPTR